METNETARSDFDEGCQSYIDQQKERLNALDLDRPQYQEEANPDADAGVQERNKQAREAIEAAEEKALAEADKAPA